MSEWFEVIGDRLALARDGIRAWFRAIWSKVSQWPVTLALALWEAAGPLIDLLNRKRGE